MGSTNTVVVVVRWQTTEASLGDVLAHIAQVRPQSLAEPGCLGYEVFQGVDEPTTLVLIERYSDRTALGLIRLYLARRSPGPCKSNSMIQHS